LPAAQNLAQHVRGSVDSRWLKLSSYEALTLNARFIHSGTNSFDEHRPLESSKDSAHYAGTGILVHPHPSGVAEPCQAE
jgi:hypothetical protein